MNKQHILVVAGVIALVAIAFWLGTTRNAEAPVEVTGETNTGTLAEDTPAEATTTSEDLTDLLKGDVDLTASKPTPKPVVPSTPVKTTPTAPLYTLVTYDGQNFSPKNVEIRLGGTVRFMNLSNDDMWIASDIHPVHSGYQVKDTDSCSGYAFDQCKSVERGGYWQFTFEKAGKYGYHNHVSAADNGSVDVIDPKEKPSIPGY